MDLIREHLIYKDVPIRIEMDALKHQDQYEVIRLLLACRESKEDVCICVTDKTNKYIRELLSILKIKTRDGAGSSALP
jgi:hypothetical protein